MSKRLVFIGEVHTSPRISQIGVQVSQRTAPGLPFSLFVEAPVADASVRTALHTKLDNPAVVCSPHLELLYRLFDGNKTRILQVLDCTDFALGTTLRSRGLDPNHRPILPLEPFYSTPMTSILAMLPPQRLLELYSQIDDVLDLFKHGGASEAELALIAHYQTSITQVIAFQAVFEALAPKSAPHIGETELAVQLRSQLQAERLLLALKDAADDIFVALLHS